MSELNYSSSESKDHSINEEKVLNVNNGEDYSLSAKYHDSEIKLNEKIINNAVWMIWVGIGLILLGMIIATQVENASKVVPLIPGAFVDIFSGTMIFLVNKSSESKQKYFENLTVVEHEQRIINLIHKSENPQFREEMIRKIVDRHCKS